MVDKNGDIGKYKYKILGFDVMARIYD